MKNTADIFCGVFFLLICAVAVWSVSSLSSDDGAPIVVELYMPTTQETEALFDILKMVRTPYIQNVALEEALREEAEVYLDGICSLEEMMYGVQAKSAIIMAE